MVSDRQINNPFKINNSPFKNLTDDNPFLDDLQKSLDVLIKGGENKG